MSWDRYSTLPEAEFELPGPPVGLAAAVVIVDLAALIPLLVDHDLLSWFGYFAASWVVAVLAVAFREVDRSRESSPLYLPRPNVRLVVNMAALLGLVIGCIHAWRVAQETSFA